MPNDKAQWKTRTLKMKKVSENLYAKIKKIDR